MLAAAGPQFQKYLWWKKYITTLQMVIWFFFVQSLMMITWYLTMRLFFQGQFCLAFLHSIQLLWQDCEYPRWSLTFILPNAMFFYFLFNEFYNSAYTDETGKRKKKDDDDESCAVAGSKVTNGKIPNGKVHANGHAHTNGKSKAA